MEKEVEKLYSHYEARLWAAMTKALRAAALQLYTSSASMFLPIPPEEQPELQSELEADPFVEHLVSSATYEMYHCFCMYLAPVTNRGANHTAPLPIWTARCSQNSRWYWHAVVSIRWKFSQHQSRRREWRVWQRLHQFRSWFPWRLRWKTPKKLPHGGPERRPGVRARRAFLQSSAQRKRQSTRDQRLLLWRQRRWLMFLLRSNSQCMPLRHIVSDTKCQKPTGPLGSYLVEPDLPRYMCYACHNSTQRRHVVSLPGPVHLPRHLGVLRN